MQTEQRIEPAVERTSADGEPSQWQRIEHHTRTLDRAVKMTQMADGKVAPILALHASLAAVTVSQSSGLGSLLTADGVPVVQAVAGWVLIVLYAAASLLAFRQVAIIYIPTAPVRGRRLHFGHSLFYFDDIQHMPVTEFEARSIAASMDDLERDVIQQTHIVAGVASRKLAGVQMAYVFSALTLAAWLPLVVLEHV